MTFLSLRNRTLSCTVDFDDPRAAPQIPAETELRRDTPFQRQTDVQYLYRAASAAGGATVMQAAE